MTCLIKFNKGLFKIYNSNDYTNIEYKPPSKYDGKCLVSATDNNDVSFICFYNQHTIPIQKYNMNDDPLSFTIDDSLNEYIVNIQTNVCEIWLYNMNTIINSTTCSLLNFPIFKSNDVYVYGTYHLLNWQSQDNCFRLCQISNTVDFTNITTFTINNKLYNNYSVDFLNYPILLFDGTNNPTNNIEYNILDISEQQNLYILPVDNHIFIDNNTLYKQQIITYYCVVNPENKTIETTIYNTKDIQNENYFINTFGSLTKFVISYIFDCETKITTIVGIPNSINLINYSNMLTSNNSSLTTNIDYNIIGNLTCIQSNLTHLCKTIERFVNTFTISDYNKNAIGVNCTCLSDDIINKIVKKLQENEIDNKYFNDYEIGISKGKYYSINPFGCIVLIDSNNNWYEFNISNKNWMKLTIDGYYYSNNTNDICKDENLPILQTVTINGKLQLRNDNIILSIKPSDKTRIIYNNIAYDIRKFNEYDNIVIVLYNPVYILS